MVRFPGGDLWRRRLRHGHRPELEDAEPPPIAAHPLLGEEHWPAFAQEDDQAHKKQGNPQKEDQGQGHQEIQTPLH